MLSYKACAEVSYACRRKLKDAIDALTLDSMVSSGKLSSALSAALTHLLPQNAPRPGKKLLVLDLDYCILDTGLWKEANFVAEREPTWSAPAAGLSALISALALRLHRLC